jgi:hypothetical protein
MRNIIKIKEHGNQLLHGAKIQVSKECRIYLSIVNQFFKETKTPSHETIRKIFKVSTHQKLTEFLN